MRVIRAVRGLGPMDAQGVRRDPLLRWMIWMPLFLGVVVRVVVPFLAGRVQAQFGLDVTPYYTLMASFILLVTPLLFGMVIGFLLLDQRDDRTLTALQVTPLALNGYLAYRIATPLLLSLMIAPVSLLLTGLVRMGWAEMFLASLAAAPLAPLMALFLASFAENKVQGFALQKAAGVVFVPPLIAYFVAMPWQLLFGIVPTFWAVKVFWALAAGEPGVWWFLALALIYPSSLAPLLLRRFDRVMTE